MIKITSNLKKIIRLFKRQRKEIDNIRLRAHRDMAVMLDRWVLMNFRGEGNKVGGWKPFRVYSVGGPRSPYGLRKSTGRGRVKGKGAGRYLDKQAKLLRDAGVMQASFSRGVFYSEDDAGIGTELDYAEYHEKGMGHLPKRRMLPNTRDVYNDIKKVYDRYLKKAVKTK